MRLLGSLSPQEFDTVEERAKKLGKTNVRLRDGVHRFGHVRAYDADTDWAACRTACAKGFKQHPKERDRRSTDAVTCLLCLSEE